VHQPRPEPPPRWRPPQSAREEARRLRDQAKEADSKAAALEWDFDSKIRRVESLQREIQLKDRELQKDRQLLADLDSDKLGERLLEWYWKFVYTPFDQHVVNQFLLAGNLTANSKRLKTHLENKITESQREIAEAESEVAGLEKELEAANAGAETV
jgi:hypothetical protein